MPTDDAFDIAWESVHDIEKGWIDDFKTGRKLRQEKNVRHRANQMKHASRLTQLLRENPQITLDQLRAGLAPEYLPQEAEVEPEVEPESAVEEIAPEGRVFDDDDSDSGSPPITEGRGPPKPPGDAVEPDITEIVEEQVSKPPGPITDSNRLLSPPPKREEQVSKPPKPPGDAVKPDITEIVNTTKPLEDLAPTNESELEALRGIDMNKLAYQARSARCPKELRLACAFVNDVCPHGDSEMDPEERSGLAKLAFGLEMMNEAETENPVQRLTPLDDEPEPEGQTGFRFPETQDKLTGKKHKGGLREVQTRLTDDPMVALEGLGANEGVPLVNHQGNPMILNGKTGWYVKHGADGMEFYHEDEEGTTTESRSDISGMKRPKQAGGAYSWPKPGKYRDVKHGKRNRIGMNKVREDINVYFPMPDSHAIDTKTGEKIASESQAADDAWTVMKNPHANPFTDFRSVLAVNEEKPPEQSIPVSDPIIMKEETPLQRLGKAGFDMVQGDNLSLLPTNLLLDADEGSQDDTSLLPAGWRNE